MKPSTRTTMRSNSVQLLPSSSKSSSSSSFISPLLYTLLFLLVLSDLQDPGRGERDHWSSMAGSDLAHPGLAVVIMGVSGCGKSTVAALLAEALGCSFIEADDYHSQANKAKMSKGIPLTDADRTPWLESLRDAIRERLDRGEDVAVSCSALQQKYREILREGDCNYKAGDYATCRVKFVCLEASAEVIAERMSRRSREGKHFMPASLLQSQVDLLQIDEAEGITEVDATVRPDAIVHDTIAQFREGLASTVC